MTQPVPATLNPTNTRRARISSTSRGWTYAGPGSTRVPTASTSVSGKQTRRSATACSTSGVMTGSIRSCHRLWVPIIRSWALTRGFALHPGTRNRYMMRYTRTQHRPRIAAGQRPRPSFRHPQPKIWLCALTRHDALASWGPMSRILYRLLVSLARSAVRSGRSKDLEIIVVRHQLTVLHRHQLNSPAPPEQPTSPRRRGPDPVGARKYGRVR